MGIKIKSDLSFKKFIPQLNRRFNKELKSVLKDEIASEILSGRSPVKGERQFTGYSASYAKKKGRKRPVDMYLTGKMINSIVVVGRKIGVLTVRFKDRKARFHNEGLGNLPERRLLPTKRGETFKPNILTAVIRRVRRIVSAETQKLNR